MTSSESNRHAVPIAKAGDAYKIERLEREVKDLRARLQMAEAERDREKSIRLRYAAEIRKFSAHGIEGEIED